MAINFKEITLADKMQIDGILQSSHKRFCEFTFGNMFCWAAAFGSKYAVFDKTIVTGNPEKRVFSVPVGKAPGAVLDMLKEQFGSITLYGIDESELDMLGGFEVKENSGAFDYIYDSEKLMTLSGKKLAAKRNHINAFTADGQWHTAPITDADCDTLLEFNRKWCRDRCKNAQAREELCAAERGIKNFSALGFSGLMLYKNGELVGYSYGEPINADTFCVHVEKADADVRGAYQMVNREFARAYCGDYKYINREDDAGDEGVRRAKLSYYPTEVGRKFKAKSK